MDAGDLILISVDHRVLEPADMFDAYVPSRYDEMRAGCCDAYEGACFTACRRGAITTVVAPSVA